MDIDRELTEAVERSAAEAQRTSLEARNAPGRKAPQPKQGLVWLLGALIVGIVILLVLPDPSAQSVSIAELTKERQRYEGSEIRVSGRLVPGSVQRHGNRDFRFVLESEGARLPVRFSKSDGPLDAFYLQPPLDEEITVTGVLTAKGHLETSLFTVADRRKYEMRQMR